MNHRIGTVIVALTVIALALPAAAAGGFGGALNTLTPDAPLAKDCGDAASGNPLASATILMDVDALRDFQAGVEPASHDPAFACEGIRPGGALILPAGPIFLAYCSMSFVVTDGVDLYVATAGHCVDEELGVGPEFYAYGVDEAFGEVAYRWCEGGDSLGNGCGPGTDFALIKVYPHLHGHVSAEMCHWGAPTGGIFTARDSEPRLAPHFGWGMGIGGASSGFGATIGEDDYLLGNPATQSRIAVGFDFTGEDMVAVDGLGFSGDSGSGIMVGAPETPLTPDASLEALGVITHIGVGLGGGIIVQRLDSSLERAEDALGLAFSLY